MRDHLRQYSQKYRLMMIGVGGGLGIITWPISFERRNAMPSSNRVFNVAIHVEA